MTATVENILFAMMQHITERITAKVSIVNWALYDLAPKPTDTIEYR